MEFKEIEEEEQVVLSVGGRGGVQGGRGERTGRFECVGGRGGVQRGRGGATIWWMSEVELEFKEDEKVFLSVLKVEMEFKEEEDDERVIWEVLRSRWSSRRKRRRNR